MNNKVKEQILNIRKSGETNMFDIPKVREIAFRKGFIELACYLAENKIAYFRFILTGEE
jgi:hypothetical protein